MFRLQFPHPRPQPGVGFASASRALSGVLLSAGLLVGCSEEVAPTAITLPPVMVVAAELRDVVDRIEATGQLVAKSEAKVASQASGQITKLHAEEGDDVSKGQIVLEIDPQRKQLEYSNQLARVGESRAQLSDTERDLARVRSLRAKGAVSVSQVEEAETQLALAQSRLDGARAQLGLAQRALADSTVVAPFAGRIARRNVSEGEYVTPGQALFSLVALGEMEVEFHLAERDSSRVALGDRVDVRVAPFPDESFEATVTVISPKIDTRTRTLRVKARVTDPEIRLRPGLFARADLGIDRRSNVVMVPEDAIVLRADGSVIFRVLSNHPSPNPSPDPSANSSARSANWKVERIPIETGVYRDGWVEVASGLSGGDRIVVRGQNRLIDGSVVDVRTADGSRPTSFARSAAREVQAAR